MYYLKSLVTVKDEDSLRVSYIKEENFVAIVRAEIDEAVLNSFLYEIYDQLADNNLTIEQLDRLVSDKIRQLSLPPSLDLSLGFLSKDRFFIKTIGTGVIYGVSNNQLVKIISAEKTAVGRVDSVSWYVLSFSDEDLAGVNSLVFSDYQDFANQIHNNALQLSAVFVNVSSLIEADKKSISGSNSGYYSKLFSINQTYLKFGLLVIIVLALVFSVYFGYQKRLTQKYESILSQTSSEVSNILADAEKTVLVNPESARELLAKAQQTVSLADDQLPDKYAQQISELSNQIQKKQAELFKETEAMGDEFFDFSLFESDYKAEYIGLSGNILAVVSSDNQIYTLNLDTKEKNKIASNEFKIDKVALEVRGGSLTSLYGFGKDGLFSFNQEKWEKLVDSDSQWVNIVDFAYYGRNLYLLDAGANQIFKHTPLETGYSQGLEYLTTDNLSFSDKARFAIDGSVYVVDGKKVYKFLRGASQSFAVDLPESDYSFDLIYTSVDSSNLYLVDKTNKKVYIIDKETGSLIEQKNTPLVEKAIAVFVYNQKIYLVTEDKIYTLD
ncbi:MAG: hypothetical protein KatS3mg090_0078 [Patescibacteria group bacterium]|nr:MAG: hypothetical protein KatS3mg090_0078 [Patescibacteria group bacterium]